MYLNKFQTVDDQKPSLPVAGIWFIALATAVTTTKPKTMETLLSVFQGASSITIEIQLLFSILEFEKPNNDPPTTKKKKTQTQHTVNTTRK